MPCSTAERVILGSRWPTPTPSSTPRPERWRSPPGSFAVRIDLADVIRSLLPDAQVEWCGDPPDHHEDDPTQLWLNDPDGGGYLVSRDDTPFTPAECARAYAMVDVSTIARTVGRTRDRV